MYQSLMRGLLLLAVIGTSCTPATKDAQQNASGQGGAGGTDAAGGRGGADSIPDRPSNKRFPSLDLPGELRWLTDGRIWTPIPGQADWDDRCTFWEGAPDRMKFPPLAWEPCGDGCQRADIKQGFGTVASTGLVSISSVPGKTRAVMRVSNGIRLDDHRVQIQRTIDLETGESLAAIESISRAPDSTQDFSSCFFFPNWRSALQVSANRYSERSAGGLTISGTWSIENQKWVWQLPWPTVEDIGFDWGYCNVVGMEDGGRDFFFCGDIVRAAITPGSSKIEAVDRPEESGYYAGGPGAALGDLVVWPEVAASKTGSRIRAWTPRAASAYTIFEVPLDTCSVGLSDTHVAGFSTSNGCSSYQSEGRLWVADRRKDGRLENLNVGPIFWPEPVIAAYKMATWGAYVAAVWIERDYSNPADRGRLVLARSTDWAMRDIRGVDGHEVWDGALTDDHLYVVYTLPGANAGQLSHVYRYELAKFDSIGKPILPVPGVGSE